MAVAPARRGPDILPVQSIPLSAVSDEPLPSAPQPPVSASADPADQANGVAKEITAEELAAAEVARRGVSPADPAATPEPATPDATAKKPGETTEPAGEEDDGITVAPGLPGYAQREIAKIRKQARERVAAALKTAKAEAGEAEWQKVFEANRDTIVTKAQEDAARATKAAKDAQEEAERVKRELEELKSKAPPTEPEAKPDEKPTRDQFDDPDLYDEALAAWGEREGLRKAEAKRQAEAAEAEAAKKKADEEAAAEKAEADRVAHEAAVTKINEDWTAARTKAIEKYPDYAEVAEAAPEDGGPVVTDAMAAAILQAGNGTDIAYHLGQNPEESKRIAEIANPVVQFIEIGKLSERLAAPPARSGRRARPVEHITDAPMAADTTDAEPDMDSYAAKRLPELQKARQPFFPPGGIH